MCSAALGGTCGYSDSGVTGGAEFWFEVPFRPVDSVEEQDKVPGASGEQDTARLEAPPRRAEPLQPAVVPRSSSTQAADLLHVLIVEDCEALRCMMCRSYEKYGHTVRTAESSYLALDEIQRLHEQEGRAFSVVLCDLHLGDGIDGHGLIAAVRSWEDALSTSKPHQVMVLMSADDLEDEAEEHFFSGADACCTKPILPDRLPTLVSEVHTARSAAQSCEASEGISDHDDMIMSDADWRRFLTSTVIPEFTDAMAGMRAKPSRQRAHAIKNIVGTLVFYDAYDEAYAIEKLLKEQDANPEGDVLRELGSRLDTLDALFQQGLPSSTQPRRADLHQFSAHVQRTRVRDAESQRSDGRHSSKKTVLV